jgi:hypothetical protein
MTKKKIITIDEFFRLKEMLQGLPEDKDIAFQIYSSQYEDREMLDQLMSKALLFEDRKNFVDAIRFKFKIRTADTLYTFIDVEEMNLVYKHILNKITGDDKYPRPGS